MDRWKPDRELTEPEELIRRRLKRTRKLFAFLRDHRHLIFNDGFQAELEGMYRDSGAGKPPVSPALMAMAVLLQGYVGASDAEAVELSVVDLRWQLVLGCLGATKPAFSQGAFHDFRHRLIRTHMDRRLLERTVEVARETGGYDARKLPKSLRVAMDSSPLEGAGRVEDTLNLLGHAARNVVTCAATLLERDFAEVCEEAGIALLLASSLKAGLDREWGVPGAKEEALEELADQIASLGVWLEETMAAATEEPPLKTQIEVLRQLVDQDLEPDPDGGGPRIKKGTAKDRRISVRDGEMRHGRKSKSQKVNGYKRHIATDVDEGLVLACAVAPANVPEDEAAAILKADIEAHGGVVNELLVDRGYITSPVVAEVLAAGGDVSCRPWAQRNGGLFPKTDFDINLAKGTVTCPAGQVVAAELGKRSTFSREACGACLLRGKCTTAKNGRTVAIAADEALQQELRKRAKTPEGRARLRERVIVEHKLAHIGQRQGKRARYFGARANLFDLRRAASLQNLETAQRRAA